MLKFLFILAVFCNPTITVRNASGKILGKIYSNGEVRDSRGILLGKVKNGHTYDSKGRRLLNKELPGYLLK